VEEGRKATVSFDKKGRAFEPNLRKKKKAPHVVSSAKKAPREERGLIRKKKKPTTLVFRKWGRVIKRGTVIFRVKEAPMDRRGGGGIRIKLADGVLLKKEGRGEMGSSEEKKGYLLQTHYEFGEEKKGKNSKRREKRRRRGGGDGLMGSMKKSGLQE